MVAWKDLGWDSKEVGRMVARTAEQSEIPSAGLWDAEMVAWTVHIKVAGLVSSTVAKSGETMVV